ncbi:MAG: putative acyl-CoA thioester hydrolase [Candidatus Dichloromethanomonas elyunquensis]|nr:MAG: putative acyl-CoA thioester hydrolase [Candidatus Dichloromethanomonas elyunquensis]
MEGKTVYYSQVVMSNLMLPHQANVKGNVHGGEIMKMMDSTAGVVAHRHSRANVVTARVDEMEFHLPIHIGNFVTCHGKLVFVGSSSMEILVTVSVEDLAKNAPPKTALTAYFTLVALDENGKPLKVAPLELVNEEERRLFEDGMRRYQAYKQHRKN